MHQNSDSSLGNTAHQWSGEPPQNIPDQGPVNLPSDVWNELEIDSQDSSSVPLQDLSDEFLLRDATPLPLKSLSVPSVGGIALLAKLGQGGMGAVYYGIHPRLKNEVAVKIMRLDKAAQDSSMVQRFVREARLAAQIRSPHLVGVLDVNEEKGLFYLVQDYIHGITAGDLLKKVQNKGQVGLPQSAAVAVGIAIAEALCAAHEKNVIHRDVKPSNILIPYGKSDKKYKAQEAKLLDLGLARRENFDQSLTGMEAALGTPGYLAPEQAVDAKNVDIRADIYGLGATMYALLAGDPPFVGESAIPVIMDTINKPHPPLTEKRNDLTPGMIQFIDQCLAKVPEERPTTAAQVKEELKAILMGKEKPVAAVPIPAAVDPESFAGPTVPISDQVQNALPKSNQQPVPGDDGSTANTMLLQPVPLNQDQIVAQKPPGNILQENPKLGLLIGAGGVLLLALLFWAVSGDPEPKQNKETAQSEKESSRPKKKRKKVLRFESTAPTQPENETTKINQETSTKDKQNKASPHIHPPVQPETTPNNNPQPVSQSMEQPGKEPAGTESKPKQTKFTAVPFTPNSNQVHRTNPDPEPAKKENDHHHGGDFDQAWDTLQGLLRKERKDLRGNYSYIPARNRPPIENAFAAALAADPHRGELHELGDKIPDMDAQRIHQKAQKIVDSYPQNDHRRVDLPEAVSQHLYHEGKHEEAQTLFGKAVSEAKRIFGEKHPRYAGLMTQLAMQKLDQNKPEEAETILRKSLSVLESAGNSDPHELAATRNAMANIFVAKEEFDKAERLLRKNYDTLNKTPDADFREKAQTLKQLGELQMRQENPERALFYLQKSMGIIRRENPNDPEMAYIHQQIGHVYLMQEKFKEALLHTNQCLKMQLKQLGSSHPDLLWSMKDMGEIYINLKNWRSGDSYLSRAMKLANKLPERDLHLEAEIYELYSSSREGQGRDREAESYRRRAEMLRKQADGGGGR